MEQKPFLPPSNRRVSLPFPRRILILWLLLILFFVALFQLFSGPRRHPAAYSPPPGGTTSLWGSWQLVLVVIGICVGAMVWAVRASRRATAMNGEGLQLMARGDLEQAAALFERLAKKYRLLPVLRVAAQHNQAAVMLRRGELQRAIDMLAAIEQSGDLQGAPTVRPLAAANMATGYALVGDTEAAEQWVAEAEKRNQRQPDPRTVGGAVALARAIVQCRQGQFTEVVRRLESEWGQLKEGLTGETLRPLRLVRAFALSQAGGPREAGAVENVLIPLRGGRPGTLNYLASQWPELQEFLCGHNL